MQLNHLNFWINFFKGLYTLQRLSLCLSHKSTLSFVDKLGVGFDAAVNEWKDDITSRKLQGKMYTLSKKKPVYFTTVYQRYETSEQ